MTTTVFPTHFIVPVQRAAKSDDYAVTSLTGANMVCCKYVVPITGLAQQSTRTSIKLYNIICAD